MSGWTHVVMNQTLVVEREKGGHVTYSKDAQQYVPAAVADSWRSEGLARLPGESAPPTPEETEAAERAATLARAQARRAAANAAAVQPKLFGRALPANSEAPTEAAPPAPDSLDVTEVDHAED